MEKERAPSYEIRPATTDDVEAIRRMQGESWRDTYRNDEHGVTQQWLEEETAKWLTPEYLEQSKELLGAAFRNPQQLYRVALKDGQVVGLLHVDTKDDGTKHLWGLYTAKQTHGSGLAQQLMHLADEWIGEKEVDLEVASYNERAKTFYRKCGFEETGETGELFKGKIPVIRMVRKGNNA